MAQNLTRIDNLPVAVGTAHAFLTRLKPAFERAFPGITLHVYSGYRSYEDQKRIFLSRYVPSNQVNGRRVYDYRWWNGTLYARISAAGTVAQPGTSNHGDGRALDIRDSAASPGVTRYGNPRSLWIRNNAHLYGFEPDGYKNFNEPWHIKYLGNQWEAPVQGSPADVSTQPIPTTPPAPTLKDDPMPLHENKGYGGKQILDRNWHPLALSSATEHRFASTGPGQREVGDVEVEITFNVAGDGTGEVAQVRILFEEKIGNKWVARKETKPLTVLNSPGTTTFQFNKKYSLGPNYRGQVMVTAMKNGVTVTGVEYTKNYWR
jgi:hypothetical protein